MTTLGAPAKQPFVERHGSTWRLLAIASYLADDARSVNRAGLIAMAVAMVLSIRLFANPTLSTGLLVVSVLAVVLSFALVPVFTPAKGAPPPSSGYEEPVRVDAASDA